MTKQIPHGPADKYCPMWRKPQSKVCHTCPWWTNVAGANPQTGERLDRWDCAMTWAPLLAVNAAREANAAACEISAFRVEVAKNNAQQADNFDALNKNLIGMHAQTMQVGLMQAKAIQALPEAPKTLLIEGGSDG